MASKWRLCVTLFALIVCSCLCQADSNYDWTKHLGTKTPYYPQQDYRNHSKIGADKGQCSVLYLNYVGRHGSRFPTASDITKLEQLRRALSSHHELLNKTDYLWMLNWTDPYKFQTAGNLDKNGELEQYGIAKRVREEYNISVPCCDTVYPIQTTQVPRAARSGNAFGFGLFEGMGSLGPSDYKPFYTYSSSLSLDTTLRFFDLCPQYQTIVLNKQWGERQAKQYEELFLADTATRISKSMGIYPYWNLTTDLVNAMYTACAFEYALSNETQNWCALFTNEDFKHFEYREDLKNWWNKAYAFMLSYEIACPLITDIILTFSDKIKNAPESEVQQAKFRFAHAETIIPLISLLSLYTDTQPLQYNSSPEFIAGRNWNSSWISPFAANVMFVLYECDKDGETEHYVKVLHNERELVLPGCDDVYCNWHTFTKLFTAYFNCEFVSMCYDNIPPPATPPVRGDDPPSPIDEPQGPSSDQAPTTCHSGPPEDYLSVTTTAAIALSAFVLGFIVAGIGAVLFVRRKISSQQQFETLVD